MFKKNIFGFLLVIFILIGISFIVNIFDNYVIIDDYENGTDFYIANKGDFTFYLKSKPSTGYSWNYTIIRGNASFTNNDFTHDGGNITCVGITGYERFKFKFNDFGLVELEFNYSRLWEDSNFCKKKFIIFVY
jgi:predicted secreted protein